MDWAYEFIGPWNDCTFAVFKKRLIISQVSVCDQKKKRDRYWLNKFSTPLLHALNVWMKSEKKNEGKKLNWIL